MQKGLSSHIQVTEMFWKSLLRPGDWVIDATCGNGRDSLRLASLLSADGGLIGLDIQPIAIEKTAELLGKKFNIHLFCQSHETFPPLALEKPIRLIVYNLGYLPGGDKTLTTYLETTLRSVENALKLVRQGGMVCLTCYSGHPEGAKEEEALLEMAGGLNPKEWTVIHTRWTNRKKAPSILMFIKEMLADC